MAMPPIIHCIRHAQGFHNLGAGNYTLSDPSLTPLGKQQCESLRASSFPNQTNISLIMASLLCRTLHTASLVFTEALASGEKNAGKILAVPDAQEISDDLCDTGSDADVLRDISAETKAFGLEHYLFVCSCIRKSASYRTSVLSPPK
jgi:broad specificity phosphatase PhoE